LIEQIFIAVLNRVPSSNETSDLLRNMRTSVPDVDATAPYQDLMWALINSNEFMLNH
jgi:hypothetical protein